MNLGRHFESQEAAAAAAQHARDYAEEHKRQHRRKPPFTDEVHSRSPEPAGLRMRRIAARFTAAPPRSGKNDSFSVRRNDEVRGNDESSSATRSA